jgi:hypothetical protein
MGYAGRHEKLPDLLWSLPGAAMGGSGTLPEPLQALLLESLGPLVGGLAADAKLAA